ncbi:hypothetical protein B0H14DRAFT_2638540 [Mycena olivaceomarginata]|nr:hypothetical protein B0H14DRAFT_2638540 [Mycena olivaceomarginata]
MSMFGHRMIQSTSNPPLRALARILFDAAALRFYAQSSAKRLRSTFGIYGTPDAFDHLCTSLRFQIGLCHGFTDLFRKFEAIQLTAVFEPKWWGAKRHTLVYFIIKFHSISIIQTGTKMVINWKGSAPAACGLILNHGCQAQKSQVIVKLVTGERQSLGAKLTQGLVVRANAGLGGTVAVRDKEHFCIGNLVPLISAVSRFGDLRESSREGPAPEVDEGPALALLSLKTGVGK